mmetsp:Transcript_3659/g.14390  ORF Transcript_3659/g.14390 Transcript_3659/m.14390 type:complete len:221 (+) Transcript_3659:2535-3197(+)
MRRLPLLERAVLMPWNLLDVLHCDVLSVKQAPVQDQNYPVDGGHERNVSEHDATHVEGLRIVLGLHFCLEAVYPADDLVLVIPSIKRHLVRKRKLQREQHGKGFASLLASVHKVAIENHPVPRAGQAGGVQNVQKIPKRSVQVSHHRDPFVRLLHEDMVHVPRLQIHFVALPHEALETLLRKLPSHSVEVKQRLDRGFINLVLVDGVLGNLLHADRAVIR